MSDTGGVSWSRDANGKYLYLFNGSAIPCTYGNDTICPASALCFQNLSWSAIPEQCACEFWLAKTGDDCNHLTHDGIILVVLGVLILLINIETFFLSAYNFYRLFRVQRDRALILLALVWLSSVGEIQLVAYWLLRLSSNSAMFIVQNGAVTTKKTSTYRIYGTVSLPLAFFLGSLALLHVSLSWISTFVSISRARTPNDVSTKTLQRRAAIYHWLLLVYYGLFFIAFVHSMIVDDITIVTLISAVAILFIVVLYGYGAWKVYRLLRNIQYVPPNPKEREMDVTASDSNSKSDSNVPVPVNMTQREISKPQDAGGSGLIQSQESDSTSPKTSNLSVPAVRPPPRPAAGATAGASPQSVEKDFVVRTLRSVMWTSASISFLSSFALSFCLSFVLIGGLMDGNNPEHATGSIIMFTMIMVASIDCFIVALYSNTLVHNAIARRDYLQKNSRSNDRIAPGEDNMRKKGNDDNAVGSEEVDEMAPTLTMATPHANLPFEQQTTLTKITSGPSALSFGDNAGGRGGSTS